MSSSPARVFTPSLSLPTPPGPRKYEPVPVSSFSSNIMQGVRLGYQERAEKAARYKKGMSSEENVRARLSELRAEAARGAPHVAEHTRGTNAVVDMAADVVQLRADRDVAKLDAVEMVGAVHGLQRLAYVLAGSIGLEYQQHLEAPNVSLIDGVVPTGAMKDSIMETSALLAKVIPLLQEIRNSQNALTTGVGMFKEAVLGEDYSAAELIHLAEAASPYGDLAVGLSRAHLS